VTRWLRIGAGIVRRVYGIRRVWYGMRTDCPTVSANVVRVECGGMQGDGGGLGRARGSFIQAIGSLA